jgi:hypothetical protein
MAITTRGRIAKNVRRQIHAETRDYDYGKKPSPHALRTGIITRARGENAILEKHQQWDERLRTMLHLVKKNKARWIKGEIEHPNKRVSGGGTLPMGAFLGIKEIARGVHEGWLIGIPLVRNVESKNTREIIRDAKTINDYHTREVIREAKTINDYQALVRMLRREKLFVWKKGRDWHGRTYYTRISKGNKEYNAEVIDRIEHAIKDMLNKNQQTTDKLRS